MATAMTGIARSHGHELMAGLRDNRHSDQGADWLAAWFGPDVTEPIRLHVAAKRYLCVVEPDYFDRLSPASDPTAHVPESASYRSLLEELCDG
jgi:predicted HD phosphohydrolase